MRIISIILVLVISSKFSAQKDTIDKPLSSFDIYYGTRPFFNGFYNQLNSTTKFNFNSPLITIGLGTSGHFIVSRGSDFYGHSFTTMSFLKQFLLKMKCKITGFMLSFGYDAAHIGDKGNFYLYMYSGFNTDKLKITGNELIKQKNPFFAPKIGVQPKIKIGTLALTFIFEYDYDISKTSWRRTLFAKTDQVTISKFRQTALTGQMGIGYLFLFIPFETDKL